MISSCALGICHALNTSNSNAIPTTPYMWSQSWLQLLAWCLLNFLKIWFLPPPIALQGFQSGTTHHDHRCLSIVEVCHRGSLFLAISVQFVALGHMRTSQCNRTCKDCDGCHERIGIYTSALVHCRQPPATQMLSCSLLLRSELNL